MEIQHAEFEISKKSLVKDLQNRCEKVSCSAGTCRRKAPVVKKPADEQVVELEMQLDEIREQYKLIVRSTNSRAQQRRVEFMEHNLEALNAVQKQVSWQARVQDLRELTRVVGGAEHDAQEGDQPS